MSRVDVKEICARKTPYPHRGAANRAAFETNRRRNFIKHHGMKLLPYRCPACGLWHLGNSRDTSPRPSEGGTR